MGVLKSLQILGYPTLLISGNFDPGFNETFFKSKPELNFNLFLKIGKMVKLRLGIEIKLLHYTKFKIF